MARYLIFDAAQLESLALGSYNVSSEQDAVQAVPPNMSLPTRVAVIRAKDITALLVVSAEDDVPTTVQRPSPPVADDAT